MSVSFSFAGKVVLITGGATGLGLATARAFGRGGAKIALNDLSPERVERAVGDVIREGQRVTYDLREDRDPAKAAGTSEMADAIIEKLQG